MSYFEFFLIGAHGRSRTYITRPLSPVPLPIGLRELVVWSAMQDLNLRPHAPKARALPAALHPYSLSKTMYPYKARNAKQKLTIKKVFIATLCVLSQLPDWNR